MSQTKVTDKTKYLIPSKEECVYTKCYCEENIWKLCEYVSTTAPDQLKEFYCVFISNSGRQIPLWHQNSMREDGCVIWDYHVLMIHKKTGGSLVYDLDTRLSFPCDFRLYKEEAIRDNAPLKAGFHRFFRTIRADEFLATFASDRSHMLKENGSWQMPPPTYPCIKTNDSSNNIQDFINMEIGKGFGEVMDFKTFVQMFLQ